MNDGGPAFPHPVMDMQSGEGYGMTLRDYFAAAVLQSDVMGAAVQQTPVIEGDTLSQHVARIAYAIADRMLQERAK